METDITKTSQAWNWHHSRMKIDSEGRKTCINCENCPDTELTMAHIFDCPVILVELLKIEVLFYEDNILQIAKAINFAYGII